MDRIDAMKVFMAALDEGSLAGAARRLGKSPAAVSRAIAFLENHVGAVGRVVVRAPRYLAQHPVIEEPADLAKHQIVSMTHFGSDSWSFPSLEGSSVPRTVHFMPRFIVNTIRAAVASAVNGRGVTRMFSYHVADQLSDGSLRILLANDEHAPLPVHLIAPHGRLQVPKVRAFADFAVPRLKAHFGRLAADAGRTEVIHSRGGRVSAG